jgi:hypothetical protein
LKPFDCVIAATADHDLRRADDLDFRRRNPAKIKARRVAA